jgi:hypothetical protein
LRERERVTKKGLLHICWQRFGGSREQGASKAKGSRAAVQRVVMMTRDRCEGKGGEAVWWVGGWFG